MTEAVNVLSTLYSSINANTIDVVTQIFDTLNEMTSGNQETRSEIINCKIIDFVNVILRTGSYSDCEEEKVFKGLDIYIQSTMLTIYDIFRAPKMQLKTAAKFTIV